MTCWSGDLKLLQPQQSMALSCRGIMAHFWKMGQRNLPYCCDVTVGLTYTCVYASTGHTPCGKTIADWFHIPLADELTPMHHKCVAGGCSRASEGIDLWWRQRSLLHFTTSDSQKKRWLAAVGRVHCIFLCLVRLSRKLERLLDCD